jgi:hypothetical protein
MLSIQALIERFFDWFGDHGCLFHNLGDSLAMVDIDTMYKALKHIYYDNNSKRYFVKLHHDAREKGHICDSMEIIPWNESDDESVECGFIYEFISEDHIPEPYSSCTLQEFQQKYPKCRKLI